MSRVLTVLAILAAIAVPQDEPEIPEVVFEDGPPPVPEERIFRGERDGPAVFVRLREGGILEWKRDDASKEITLDELGTILETARDRDELKQRQTGKSVFEEPPDPPMRLFLSIEADPGVPWQHIQWIMTVAAEQKYRKLEMREGKRKLLANISGDSSAGREPAQVEAEVHLVARAEEPARWGEAEVLRPTVVRWRWGDTETADFADVAAHLNQAKKAVEEKKDPSIVFLGVIKAGNKVPYAKVFDVMDAFVAAGIEKTGFYGTAIPTKAVRSAKRLKYPSKNYGAED
jgi:biopolymer transport protein ExbD